MNQILQTNFNQKSNRNSELKLYQKIISLHYRFKTFFLLSVIFAVLSIGIFSYNTLKILQSEKLSNTLVHNYSTLQLYSQDDPFNIPVANLENNLIGTIKIPAIHLSYPFFSRLDNESLRISPCRFHGNMPPTNSNLCIAGHNYDNGKFFSNLSTLKKGDIIHIETNHQDFSYSIFDMYEVSESDLSPIYEYSAGKKQLTLVTCNNINQKRLIVKASYVDSND